jgi:hypothetical protein
LGSFSHSLADVLFDRYFVTAVAEHDFSGDVDKAQEHTHPGFDFMAILEHNRGFKFSTYKTPYV